MPHAVLLWIAIFTGLIILRSAYIILQIWHSRRRNIQAVSHTRGQSKAHAMIVLGSGGHTKEMMSFVEALGSSFHHRTFLVAETDKFSYEKVTRLQQEIGDTNYEILRIPRSREVRQSYLSSIVTTIKAFILIFPLVLLKHPDILICNGPGTCIPVCCTAFILRCLFVHTTKIVYIESICRVNTLSLSGKLLYYFSDSFIVQWPDLLANYPYAKYLGRLM